MLFFQVWKGLQVCSTVVQSMGFQTMQIGKKHCFVLILSTLSDIHKAGKVSGFHIGFITRLGNITFRQFSNKLTCFGPNYKCNYALGCPKA